MHKMKKGLPNSMKFGSRSSDSVASLLHVKINDFPDPMFWSFHLNNISLLAKRKQKANMLISHLLRGNITICKLFS